MTLSKEHKAIVDNKTTNPIQSVQIRMAPCVQALVIPVQLSSILLILQCIR